MAVTGKGSETVNRTALDSHITPEQLETYEQKGYMIIDDPCPPELLDTVRDEVEYLYHEDFGVSDLNYVSEDGLRFSGNVPGVEERLSVAARREGLEGLRQRQGGGS